MTANWASLSPELLLYVLQSLSSPKDLYSAITASSCLYRVYKCYKHPITLAILEQAIPLEIEADFVLAYEAQHIWNFVVEPTDDVRLYDRKSRIWNSQDRLMQESLAILELSQSEHGKQMRELSSDRKVLLNLWNLYKKFEYLMLLYIPRALSALKVPSIQQGSRIPRPRPLSTIEQNRLKRALFRFEYYTCLFQISQAKHRDSYDDVPLSHPALKYLQSLSCCEVEALSCIGQFYVMLVEELCDKIEDDFVSAVKQKTETFLPRTAPSQPQKLGPCLDYVCLHWYDPSFKSVDRKRHVQYLVSRGVFGIFRLIALPLDTVKKMVVRTHFTSKRQTLIMDSMQSLDRFQEAHDHERKGCECDCHTFGWQIARNTMGTTWTSNAPCNYDLRNQGYVFWNKLRLKHLEQFKHPRARITSSCQYPVGYEAHSDVGRLQDGLGSTPIYQSVINEIADEICPEFEQEALTDDTDYEDDIRTPFVIHWRD